MRHLFRYTPSQYLDSFLDGNIRFQPLSVYQRYEDQDAIGDPYEAKRLFQPTQGLHINNHTTGQRIIMHGGFESLAQANAIFVFCMSRVLNQEIARKFKSNTCIEITNSDIFLSKLQAAVEAEFASSMLFHGTIYYYRETTSPGALGWALPQRIAMSKRVSFKWQREYRVSFAERKIFDIGNTIQQINRGRVKITQSEASEPPRVISIGNIRSICVVHRLDAI